MTKKIVVGGPPRSGKSTFVASMRRALLDIGVRADYVELDPYASTLALLEGLMTPEERLRSKRKDISNEEILQVAERLASVAESVDILLGDLPGMITEQTRMLCRYATHAIIICSDQSPEQMSEWHKFFEELRIPVIAKIVSKLHGNEEVKSTNRDTTEAVLIGLDREVKVGDTLTRIAIMLETIMNL
ncbi:MAG TPA: hypothetical protein VFF30_10150 [Nitrososphaerales archaeon]|nr:hypothetical protein [Nitrososphaerales archaeon]